MRLTSRTGTKSSFRSLFKCTTKAFSQYFSSSKLQNYQLSLILPSLKQFRISTAFYSTYYGHLIRLLSYSALAWHFMCAFYSISRQSSFFRLPKRYALSSYSISLTTGMVNSKAYQLNSFFNFLPRLSSERLSLSQLIDCDDLERSLSKLQDSSSMKLQTKDSTSFWWFQGTTSFCTNYSIFFCRLGMTGSDQSLSLKVFLYFQLENTYSSTRCVSQASQSTLLSLFSRSSSPRWLTNTMTLRSGSTTILSSFSNSSRCFLLRFSLPAIALRSIDKKDSLRLLLIFSLRKGSSFNCLRTRLLNCRTDWLLKDSKTSQEMLCFSCLSTQIPKHACFLWITMHWHLGLNSISISQSYCSRLAVGWMDSAISAKRQSFSILERPRVLRFRRVTLSLAIWLTLAQISPSLREVEQKQPVCTPLSITISTLTPACAKARVSLCEVLKTVKVCWSFSVRMQSWLRIWSSLLRQSMLSSQPSLMKMRSRLRSQQMRQSCSSWMRFIYYSYVLMKMRFFIVLLVRFMVVSLGYPYGRFRNRRPLFLTSVQGCSPSCCSLSSYSNSSRWYSSSKAACIWKLSMRASSKMATSSSAWRRSGIASSRQRSSHMPDRSCSHDYSIWVGNQVQILIIALSQNWGYGCDTLVAVFGVFAGLTQRRSLLRQASLSLLHRPGV